MTPLEASEILRVILSLIGLFAMGRWTCRMLDRASWSRRVIENRRRAGHG